MNETNFTLKFLCTEPIVREILRLYIRKRLALKVGRLLIIYILLAIAYYKGMVLAKADHGYPWALGYVVSAMAFGFAGYLQYQYVKIALDNLYRSNLNATMECRFTDTKVVISREGKQSEFFWEELREVWSSKSVLIFIGFRKRFIALPIVALEKDQIPFVVHQLKRLSFLKRVQAERLLRNIMN